jgi:putative effector of murein hydrolase LrgA (UPF0299 family)
MTLIGFLIAVLIILVVVYVGKLVIDFLELPPPIAKIAMLVLALIALIALFNQLGYIGAPMRAW